LTTGLMLLPSILSGKPHLILIDHRLQVFLVIMALWVVLEARGSNQVMLHNEQRQHTWLPYVMSASMLCLFLTSLTERALSEITPFTILSIIGAIMMIAGVLLRYFAIRTLGNYFLDDVTVISGQPLITTGIYSRLRHPSEAGNLCIASGAAFLPGSWIGLAIAIFLVLPIVIIRIKLEDRMLMNHYPDTFPAYQQDVPALLPFKL